MTRYPIHETSAFSEIAKKLGFRNKAQYEAAIRKLLMENEEELEFVKSLFGGLVEVIE